jgi:cytosine/adenosine deaminase-related metal-dependent hydrolase
MIVRARAVVTMDGAPIENGAVAISRDRITDVGKFPEVSARHSGQEIIDLGEKVLLPGLINAHCHLDYTCLRGKIPRQKSFTDWIRAINAEKSKLSPQDYLASINEGLRRQNDSARQP